MRTSLTSEQHRFEAIMLGLEADKLKRNGRICMAYAKALQAIWHYRRMQERISQYQSVFPIAGGCKP